MEKDHYALAGSLLLDNSTSGIGQLKLNDTKTGLLFLPGELIEQIVTSVGLSDFKSLRLVCTNLALKSSHYFGRVCLNTIVTDLSFESLSKLREIAAHPVYRHNVRVLSIVPRGDYYGHGLPWPRDGQGHLIAPAPGQLMGIALGGPAQFMGLGVGTEWLKCILGDGLSNCRSFRFDADRRDRTAPQDLRSIKKRAKGLNYADAVAVILSVIIHAALPLEEFVLNRPSEDWERPRREHLNMELIRSPAFKEAWKGLKVLKLNSVMWEYSVDWLYELMRSAIALTKLTLQCSWGEFESHQRRLVAEDWHWPCLRQLKLEFTDQTEEMVRSWILNQSKIYPPYILLQFLMKLVCLEELKIEGDYIEPTRNCWAELFGLSGNCLPSLKSLCIRALNKECRLYGTLWYEKLMHDPVTLEKSATDRLHLIEVRDAKGLVTAAYQGPALTSALKVLAEEVDEYMSDWSDISDSSEHASND